MTFWSIPTWFWRISAPPRYIQTIRRNLVSTGFPTPPAAGSPVGCVRVTRLSRPDNASAVGSARQSRTYGGVADGAYGDRRPASGSVVATGHGIPRPFQIARSGEGPARGHSPEEGLFPGDYGFEPGPIGTGEFPGGRK